MNVEAFRRARNKFLKERPYNDPKKLQQVLDAMAKAAAPERVSKYIGDGHSDRFECSCGWKSRGF